MSQLLFRNLNSDYIQYREQLSYRSQIGLCVVDALKQRKFTRSEDNWDIFWVQKECLDNFYANHRVGKDQRVNHFRTYYEKICRKDNLNRNLKKYRRTLEREGKTKQAAQYNFTPMTYHFPIEYAVFLDEFKKLASANKSNIWIMKPTSKSQGKGIFLFNRLAAIQEWAENPEAENYICQKYIENPLLIGHKKFDLRLYVLCTSYRPLNIYLYREGFARFTHYRYEIDNISNNELHLTNVAIQKQTSEYNKQLGGKMSLTSLKLHLFSKYPRETVNTCFFQIKNLIIKTLQSVTKIMSNEGNCFQLYGFDIMLDQLFHPILIQINGSPSMRANTKSDKELKVGIIDDLLSVVDLEGVRLGNEETIGGFDLICQNNQKRQNQYYSGIYGMAMLGCKLEREKNYRNMAYTLNNHYKNNKKSLTTSPQKIIGNRILPSSDQINSPTKKGFSVRKQKRGNSFSKSEIEPPVIGAKQSIILPNSQAMNSSSMNLAQNNLNISQNRKSLTNPNGIQLPINNTRWYSNRQPTNLSSSSQIPSTGQSALNSIQVGRKQPTPQQPK